VDLVGQFLDIPDIFVVVDAVPAVACLGKGPLHGRRLDDHKAEPPFARAP
jgi:hypothetical protein